MKTTQVLRLSTLAAAVGLVVSGAVWAEDENTAQHTITYQLDDVAVFNLSESPDQTITITSADIISSPGASYFYSAMNTSVKYDMISMSPSSGTKQLMAKLTGDAMPTGIDLMLTVADPDGEGGTTASAEKALTTSNAAFLTGIPTVNVTAQQINLRLRADPATAAAMSATATVTVVYTLVDS